MQHITGLEDCREEKNRYITEKGLTLLLEQKKATYHHNPKCHYITNRGGSGILLSEKEVVDHMKQLRPCTACAGGKLPAKVEKLPPKVFPFPSTVTVWTCSDGQEFYGEKGEKEALWYELELTKKRLNKK